MLSEESVENCLVSATMYRYAQAKVGTGAVVIEKERTTAFGRFITLARLLARLHALTQTLYLHLDFFFLFRQHSRSCHSLGTKLILTGEKEGVAIA